MRMIGRVILSACGLMALGAGAFACPAQGTIFSDRFTDSSGGWPTDKNISYGPSGMTATIGPNSGDENLNATFNATVADYCTDAVFPTAPATSSGAVSLGLAFLASDFNNMYVFEVSTNGGASFYRRVAGNWTQIVALPNAGVKTGPGAVNEVRAVVNNNMVVCYVNGQKVSTTRLPINPATNQFGVYFENTETAPASFKFKSLTVNPAQ